MELRTRSPRPVGGSPVLFWVILAVLFFLILLLFGRPVPWGNEFVYLPRLDPNFLPNDWTFSKPASEHWLFNTIFRIPAMFLSLEVVGWVGRIVFWILCLSGLIKLGEHWEIPHWSIGLAVVAWVAANQSVVNDEWIFGGFEAKVVSYASLLFALNKFARGQLLLASALLGLSFSFHPAVGLWAVAGAGLALVSLRLPLSELFRAAGITILFCLPGILPLIMGEAAAASYEDWKFIVTLRMPHHFDPFYFSTLRMIVLGIMFAFNLVALWSVESFALRFLRNFQVAIGLFFVLGVVLRVFEMYPLLRFMPMRLFPVLIPLFFFFSVCYLWSRQPSLFRKMALVFGSLVIFGLLEPVDNLTQQISETRNKWSGKRDSFETALIWISQNTPRNAVVISSPVPKEQWYLSQRAQIVSWSYPRYEQLAEWRQRVADVTGNVRINDPDSASEIVESGFASLSAGQIVELQQKYSADHLVSTADYSFPVIFETGTHKVYRLQK